MEDKLIDCEKDIGWWRLRTRITDKENIKLKNDIVDLVEALIWCSASQDFQFEGKARVGWDRMCMPLIKRHSKPTDEKIPEEK